MSVNPDYVYRGYWKNWDGGSVSGGRITMSQRSADLLNIFSGIFITFAQGGLWAIIAYGIYHYQNSKHDDPTADGLHSEKQVILRNNPSDISTSASIASLGWTWRTKRAGYLVRTALVAIGALVNFLFFVIAVPFIFNRISSTVGDEVLVKSPFCGFWRSSTTLNEATAYSTISNRTWDALNYVNNCYNTDKPSTLCDDYLISRTIPWKVRSDTGCPFATELCLHDYLSYSMETDVLDSHKDLGINAPPEDRISFQRKTTCAPLNMTGRVDTTAGFLDGEVIYTYRFGVEEPPLFGDFANYTTYISSFANISGVGFVVQTFEAYANSSDPNNIGPRTFIPIPGLQRTDGDVTLVFLANNGVILPGPCEDPFFSATKNIAYRGTTVNYYSPDYPMTVMGCVDQYAIIDKKSHQETNYVGVIDMQTNYLQNPEKWKLSNRQIATLGSLHWAAGEALGVSRMLQTLGAEALATKKWLWFGSISTQLPKTQWTVEAGYWFDISLAIFQNLLVDIATGPSDPSHPGLTNILPEISDGLASGINATALVCGHQKVKSTMYANFHAAGFITFIVVGFVLIVSPLVVIPVLQNFVISKDRKLAWVEDGNLELLRKALEVKGSGSSGTPLGHGVLSPLDQNTSSTGNANNNSSQDPNIAPRPSLSSNRPPQSTPIAQHRLSAQALGSQYASSQTPILMHDFSTPAQSGVIDSASDISPMVSSRASSNRSVIHDSSNVATRQDASTTTPELQSQAQHSTATPEQLAMGQSDALAGATIANSAAGNEQAVQTPGQTPTIFSQNALEDAPATNFTRHSTV